MPLTLDALPVFAPAGGAFGEVSAATQRPPARSPKLMRPGTKALRAQAQERRDTREEAIDAVLALIEDAHSADPLLFGPGAAGHFARPYEARSASRC